MSILDTRIARLKRIPGGRIADRLRHEISYARRVSQVMENRYETLLMQAIDQIEQAFAEDGALTDPRALAIEQTLLAMQPDCKKYKLMLCGHAHIDMNWMWRYDETVQITLDTFATVLKLMREFPDFTYSQSQASVYRIVEEHAPEMLDEIRMRIREGRWEVSASTWVEADRNMGSAESVARHHLYTLNYLPKLLGCERPQVDFEPDTFGHHQNTPELLAQAGVKYYYHCRGLEGYPLYRWRAPSGAEVLVYHEPFWYNDTVRPEFAEYVPEFCETYGVESALRVYGVGDHGGGPTRRDLKQVVEMQTWPLFPTIEFGTYAKFFAQAERATKPIPVIDRELNAVFTGCYTTQTRIKKGNRYGERLLAEAECINSIAHAVADAPYRSARFEHGWRNVLFNQFHDILPGSGVTDTREHAMGLYQESYAVANSARRMALKAITDKIDTSAIPCKPCDGDLSTGAGVGFRVEESINLAPVEFGQGMTRIYHLFNACPNPRDEVVELVVWDYSPELGEMEVSDAQGNILPHQIVEQGHNSYWGHDFTRVFVRVCVPATGYTTVVIRPKDDIDAPVQLDLNNPREEIDECWTLENEHLRVECDPSAHDGRWILTEKDSGAVHTIDGFHLITEDASRGMTAWVLGDPVSDTRLTDIRMKRTASGPLYNELTASIRISERSMLQCRISLSAGSKTLELSCEAHWLETADTSRGLIPQLFFKLEADEKNRTHYTYDIPGGVLERRESAQDLPGIRFIAGGRLMLLSDCKYGYRGSAGSMGATLIRSSFDPDPYPELGVHRIHMGIALTDGESACERIVKAECFSSPITAVSGESHEGKLPTENSFVELLSGSVELQAMKLSEDGKSLILRGVELSGDGKDVCIRLGLIAKSAHLTDTLEEKNLGPVQYSDGCLKFSARPHGMFSMRIDL